MRGSFLWFEIFEGGGGYDHFFQILGGCKIFSKLGGRVANVMHCFSDKNQFYKNHQSK